MADQKQCFIRSVNTGDVRVWVDGKSWPGRDWVPCGLREIRAERRNEKWHFWVLLSEGRGFVDLDWASPEEPVLSSQGIPAALISLDGFTSGVALDGVVLNNRDVAAVAGSKVYVPLRNKYSDSISADVPTSSPDAKCWRLTREVLNSGQLTTIRPVRMEKIIYIVSKTPLLLDGEIQLAGSSSEKVSSFRLRRFTDYDYDLVVSQCDWSEDRIPGRLEGRDREGKWFSVELNADRTSGRIVSEQRGFETNKDSRWCVARVGSGALLGVLGGGVECGVDWLGVGVGTGAAAASVGLTIRPWTLGTSGTSFYANPFVVLMTPGLLDSVALPFTGGMALGASAGIDLNIWAGLLFFKAGLGFMVHTDSGNAGVVFDFSLGMGTQQSH